MSGSIGKLLADLSREFRIAGAEAESLGFLRNHVTSDQAVEETLVAAQLGQVYAVAEHLRVVLSDAREIGDGDVVGTDFGHYFRVFAGVDIAALRPGA